MDKELENKIINCSRCGLCMEICPVYKVKKTETSVLRGKFLQLLGLIKGHLKYDKKIKYNLDLCLSCGKCRTACPSALNAVEIFAKIRKEFAGPFEKFFYSASIFKLKIFLLKIFYKIKYPIGKHPYFKPVKNKKTAYFNGCVTKAAGENFMLPNGYKKEKFKCCALPFYIKGRFDIYEKYKKKNIELINKYDRVVFSCATCYDTVLNYEGVDKTKLFYFSEFYKNQKLYAKRHVKAVFHKPCHLSLEIYDDICKILGNIEGVEFVSFEGSDDCCGFGGDFFTRHPKTAAALSIKKIENIQKTGADIVLTTCPACLWGLKFGIKAKGAKLKAYDLASFLYGACIAG